MRLTRYLEESISLLPTLFAAIVFGPLAAMLVAAASMIGAFGPPYLKWATYTCTRALTGAATGLAAGWAADLRTTHIASVVIATTVGTLVSQVLDAVVRGSNPTCAKDGESCGAPPDSSAPRLLGSPLLRAYRRGACVRVQDVSPWTLPLFFIPALAAQRLFGLYQQERTQAKGLAEANIRLERATISFAKALVTTLDARDRYTAGHSAAVAIYARDIAQRLGIGRGTAAARPPLWTCPRHRQDRTTARSSREAGRAYSRRAAPDAGAFGNRRTHPRRSGTTPKSPRSSGIITSASMAWDIRMGSKATRFL